MADYWDEHGTEDEAVDDIFDFIRRLNSGQLSGSIKLIHKTHISYLKQ